MLAKERHDIICELIHKNGAVQVSDLVRDLNVSIETIRKDLLYLEKEGHLSRVHGGAILKSEMLPHRTLKHRIVEGSTQKHELALKAAEFVDDGDVIGIDAGSTATAFAEVLKQKFNNLTVVTHSLDVFEALNNCPGIKIILCGGHYMHDENAFYGPLTIDMLDKIRVQKAFVCPAVISLEYGICDNQPDLFQIQQHFLRATNNVYILADSSKFEKRALLKLDNINTRYNYITDSDFSDELVKVYKENNIEIHKWRSAK